MPNTIDIGQRIPNLAFTATSNLNAQLNDFSGHNLVIYFYPKDHTPGCTHESKDFRDHFEQFQTVDTLIFGVSRNNLTSHERFKQKWNLPFELIADEDSQLCEAFGVLRPKLLFGRSLFGIVRSTFLIDRQGIIRQAWRGVKTHGHAQAVLQAAQALQN